MWYEAPRHLYPVCACGRDATVMMVTEGLEWVGKECECGWYTQVVAVSLFCDECHHKIEEAEGEYHEVKSTAYLGPPDYVISGCLDSRRSD